MDFVIHEYSGEKFTIYQFNEMDDIKIEKIRHEILCPECKGKAFYRVKSSDGKEPHFGAKHIGECDNASNNNSRSSEGNQEVNKREVDLSEFVVYWNYSKHKDDNNDNEIVDEVNDIHHKNKRKYVLNPSKKVKGKITLPRILNLAYNNLLGNQELIILINGERKNLKDVIFNLDSIDQSLFGQSVFAWGRISNIIDNFINTSYDNGVSIIIDKPISQEFSNKYYNKLNEDISKDVILVFGTVIKKQNRLYVVVKDLKKFYYTRK